MRQAAKETLAQTVQPTQPLQVEQGAQVEQGVLAALGAQVALEGTVEESSLLLPRQSWVQEKSCP
jgi:hypothetical protein